MTKKTTMNLFVGLFAGLLLMPLAGCPCPPRPVKPAPVPTCTGIDTSAKPKCLKLKLAGARDHEDGNIQLFFQVLDCEDNPYPELDVRKPEELFDIAEDEKPISQLEAGVTILPRAVAAKVYTLILLDLSDSIRKSKELASLQKRALEIVKAMATRQEVGVAIFDGRPDIELIQDYTGDVKLLTKAIEGLKDRLVKDPSTNLFGAYIAGLEHLTRMRKESKNALARGNLIIITDGSDQAGRRSLEDARSAGKKFVDSTGPIITIGVGGEVNEKTIKALGLTRAYTVGAWAKFDKNTIGQIIKNLEDLARSLFVLSYCSPKRAGNHTVRIQLKGYAKAVVTHSFDADGYSGQCDSRWVLKDCRYIQCGGPKDSKCQTCPEGLHCHQNRCISKELLDRLEARENADRYARTARRDKQLAKQKTCFNERAERKREWKKYNKDHQRYIDRDCDQR